MKEGEQPTSKSTEETLKVQRMGWDVLVVDDEPNVREVTALALSRLAFEGMPLKLHYASSAETAIESLQRIPGVAVVLLDVVMEHETSGLELISYVRGTLKNPFVRFILRTGQAGAAPESEIIQNYDIQEYWNKVDLTVKRLRNTIISALRSYVSLVRVERRREISDLILQQSRRLQEESADETQFIELIAKSIVGVFANSRYTMPHDADHTDAFSSLILQSAKCGDPHCLVACAQGRFEGWTGLSAETLPDLETRATLLDMIAQQEPIVITQDDHQLRLLLTFCAPGIRRSALYLQAAANSLDPCYLMTLAAHAQTIFKSKSAHWLTRRSYAESALRLAGIAEARLGGNEDRLQRVAHQARLMALRGGCSAREAELLAQASALRDVGNIKLPDAILIKPGPLTDEEWMLVRTHPILGYDLLAASSIDDLKAGALIALEHHEKWDGSGYPHGKRGLDISLGARLTSIIDVHDRMTSDRPYRKALPASEALSFLKDRAGTDFDPDLVANFFDIYDEIAAVTYDPHLMAAK